VRAGHVQCGPASGLKPFLAVLLGIWFIIMGIFEIIGGIMLRREQRVTVMSLT
jgi:uncharacterized membrane protein HdeD (DUF308 family)